MPLIREIRALGASRSETGAGRLRRSGEWRLVVLDNGRRLRVDAEQVARHGLEAGGPIDTRLLARLAAGDAHLSARESALRLLAVRPRSASEIAEALARRRVPKAAIQAVVAGLTADGLLDDLAFARAWIARRTSGSQYGSRRIRWELRQKGVPAATIDRAFSEYRAAGHGPGEGGITPSGVARRETGRDGLAAGGAAGSGTAQGEEQLALALVRGRARQYRSLQPDRRARRIAALLQRRGFSAGTIVRVLRSVGGAEGGEAVEGAEPGEALDE